MLFTKYCTLSCSWNQLHKVELKKGSVKTAVKLLFMETKFTEGLSSTLSGRCQVQETFLIIDEVFV